MAKLLQLPWSPEIVEDPELCAVVLKSLDEPFADPLFLAGKQLRIGLRDMRTKCCIPKTPGMRITRNHTALHLTSDLIP